MNVALQSSSDTSIPLPQGSLQLPLSAPFPSPLALSSEGARLKLLRQHDRTRSWASAREKRTCMLCGSEFEGVQIRIGVRAGKPVFGCPEPHCRGSLPHFAVSGNPLLDDEAWSDWMRPPGEFAPAAPEGEACSL